MLSAVQLRVLPYAIVILLGYIGFALPLPILPEMFLDPERAIVPASFTQGQRVFFLGLLMSCYPLGQLFGSPLLGMLSDRFGRKRTILFSLAITALCYLFIASCIHFNSLVGIFIGLLICGFSEGNVSIAQSVIADIAANESKAAHFGWINIFVSCAFIIGPLMGGTLADPTYVSWFTFSTPFLMAALITLVGWGIILFVSKETRQRKEAGTYKLVASFSKIFKKPEMRLFFLANFLFAFGFYAFFRFLPVYLEKNYNFTTSQLAYVIAYDALWVALAVTFLIPVAAKHFHPKKSTAAASILYGFFLIILLFPSMPQALWLTIPPIGICFAISITNGAVIVSNQADYEIHGQAMGCLQSVQVLAAVITGVLGGWMAAFNPSYPLVWGALLSIASGMILHFGAKKFIEKSQ